MENFVSIRISITRALDFYYKHDSPLDLANGVQAINLLFNTFAQFEMAQWQEFSMIEWNLLVRTIISIFELLNSALSQSPVNTTQIQELSSFTTSLEKFQSRMKQLSKIKTDIFALFDSVLQVVIETYRRMCDQLRTLGNANVSYRSQCQSMPSLCPVANGSLRNTMHGINSGQNWSVYETLLSRDI
jgi:hypothetical protein